MNVNQQQEIKVHSVWDLPVRLFHWINFLSVITLLFMGFIMLYKNELGITCLRPKLASSRCTLSSATYSWLTC